MRDAALSVLETLRNRNVRRIVRAPRAGGLPGVHHEPATDRRPACWFAATLLPDGRNWIRRFSVARFGEDEARCLAETTRLADLAATRAGDK